MTHRLMILLLIPAILLVGGFVAFRVYQFQRLTILSQPKEETADIPIFAYDPIIGNKKAPITLIVFSDLGCESCKAQDRLFEEIEAAHPGKVKLIWKALSTTLVPFPTQTVHLWAYCANKQGKLGAFKQGVYSNQEILNQNILSTIATNAGLDMEKLNLCVASDSTLSALKRNEELATALNIQEVPTIFRDNKQLTPPTTVSGWETLLGL